MRLFLAWHHIIELEAGAAAFLEIFDAHWIKSPLQWHQIGSRMPVAVQAVISNGPRAADGQG